MTSPNAFSLLHCRREGIGTLYSLSMQVEPCCIFENTYLQKFVVMKHQWLLDVGFGNS